MSCLICDRIQMIQAGTNLMFVAELETGYVVLGDTQYFPGYTLFLAKAHYTELHLMPEALKHRFMEEMSWVSEACATAFAADKMNLELLGNGDSHVHWHLFPRHVGDTKRPGPVWWADPEAMFADNTAPTATELATRKQALQTALQSVLAKYAGGAS